MKKLHKTELLNIKRNEKIYGYIVLGDYSKYYHLSNLKKIIELKSVNRKLSNMRKSLEIKLLDECEHGKPMKHKIVNYTNSIINLSEQIGKNGHKIQRIRTQYKKFSDKWIEKRLNRNTGSDEIAF